MAVKNWQLRVRIIVLLLMPMAIWVPTSTRVDLLFRLFLCSGWLYGNKREPVHRTSTLTRNFGAYNYFRLPATSVKMLVSALQFCVKL